MSSFAGLHTALSGLVAQRYGLDTTGANVSNANTPGYTRQRVIMEPTNPLSTGSALFSRWDGPGTGVLVTDLQRVTDELVATRVRTERSTAEFMAVERTDYSRLEVSLGEPGKTGLTERLSTMWASFQDLANNPGSEAARNQVLQAARGVTDSLGAAAAGVEQAWSDQHSALKLAVAEVNNASAAVAELNAAIREATAAGKAPNELLDQRDALVVRLSELTGGTVRTGELGTVDVFVGGTAIVRGERATPLAVGTGGAGTLAAVRAGGTVGITGIGFSGIDVPGGRIGAVLVGLNTTWDKVMDSLDSTAVNIAGQVNTLHNGGVNQNGSVAGDLFSGDTAAGLRVAIVDPRQLAAAPAVTPASATLDGSLADKIGKIGQQVDSPDAAWRRFVADVGSQAQAANRRSTAQAVVVGDVMAARESVSGVDIDEELTNMVMFQRAYEASARMLTAVDQALDTLINRTGLVGR